MTPWKQLEVRQRCGHFEELSGSAAGFVALTLMLGSCLHSPWGPVASTATSMTLSGSNHCRNSRKRKSKTAANAKMEPATGPQWALSLRNRLSRGSTSSLDTLSYTWEGKHNDQSRQTIPQLLFSVKLSRCSLSCANDQQICTHRRNQKTYLLRTAFSLQWKGVQVLICSVHLWKHTLSFRLVVAICTFPVWGLLSCTVHKQIRNLITCKH